MKQAQARWLWAMLLVAVLVLVAGASSPEASHAEDEAMMQASDAADWVVLGEEDLAEQAEILRNQYRRMTPGDGPLVQDVGSRPAAWEEFSPAWDGAAAERDLATWVVPVTAAREGTSTVLRDADGAELWNGTTDFAKDDSANVVLTGTLVDEAEWPLYVAAKEEIATRLEAASPMKGRGGPCTNGLRFTNMWMATNGDYHFDLAWETNGDVQVFCRAMHTETWTNHVVWTNDENEVVTNDFVRWRQVDTFHGVPDDWVFLGITTITNGSGSFTDTNHVPDYDRVRFYTAAELADTDEDGLSDGEEWLGGTSPTMWDTDDDGLSDFDERNNHHTDPNKPDTDGDGLFDGFEVMIGFNPLMADEDEDGLNDGEEWQFGTDPDNPDSDSDGLPDGWEAHHGLNPDDPSGEDGADGDPDNDGFPNALEFALDAPPNNAAWNGAELAWKLTHHMATVAASGGVITTNWQGLCVEVEDSLDCGGTNDGIQNETEDLDVPSLLDCGYYVELVVTGAVEDVDAGYDVVSFEVVTANGATTNVFFSSHDGIPDGQPETCQMVDESATDTVLVVPNSTVRLRYNTVGHKWHCGAYAEVRSAVVVEPLLGGFELVRERDAPCNRAPNPKQHVHTNRLFIATEASGQVEIDVIPVIPPAISGSPVLCAVYEGNTHLASASPDADGIAALSFTPGAKLQINDIRFGIDVNANGVLEPDEFRATTNTMDVLSFTHAHYTNRLDYLEDQAWEADAGLNYDVGTSLLYTFLNRPGDVDEPFDSNTTTNVNCFTLSSLTHNAGAEFDSSGDVTLALHAWNSASEASTKISESAEIAERIDELLTSHAAEVNAFFETHPDADEHGWTWTTNDVPVNFANEHRYRHPWEYDLHVAFGNVTVSQMSVGVVVKKEFWTHRLYIDQLTLAGHFVDLYDFDYDRGGLNTDGAVLQLGWDADNPARNAGHIFFDQVDFGRVFGSWSFDFERMNHETNAIPTP